MFQWFINIFKKETLDDLIIKDKILDEMRSHFSSVSDRFIEKHTDIKFKIAKLKNKNIVYDDNVVYIQRKNNK